MKKTESTFIGKVILSLLLSSTLTLASSTATYAEKITENEIISSGLNKSIQELIDKYVKAFPDLQNEILGTVEIVTRMSSYISIYEQDEQEAYELLQGALDNLVSHSGISTYGADYKGTFYADYTVPAVKQSTGFNCGIAAALQAVIGNGFLTNTYSNKTAAKMTELAGYVKYDESSKKGAQAWQVRDVMNHYEADVYDAIPITKYNIDYIFTDMENSFIKGYCPIVSLSDTSKLSYYQGQSYSHWVTVSMIDDIHHTITLVDPFNSDKCGGLSSFGGVHTVTYDEFIDAIGVGSDCWLILKTQYPQWAA